MRAYLYSGVGLAIPALLILLGANLRGGPGVEVELGSPALERMDGRLLFQGRPLDGVVIERHGDGVVKERTEYRDGVRHGVALAWHANGLPRFERGYVRGREHGTHLGWHADGSVHFEYVFADGVHEGVQREWFPGGRRLLREFNYRKGHEDGRQVMWNPDGTIRANYVVRDGRRYGLIGSKGCVGSGAAGETADR